MDVSKINLAKVVDDYVAGRSSRRRFIRDPGLLGLLSAAERP